MFSAAAGSLSMRTGGVVGVAKAVVWVGMASNFGHSFSAIFVVSGQKGEGSGKWLVLISKIGVGMLVLGGLLIKKSKTNSTTQNNHNNIGKIVFFHGKPLFFFIFKFGVSGVGGAASSEKSFAIVTAFKKIGGRQVLRVCASIHHHRAQENNQFAFLFFFLPIVENLTQKWHAS